MQAQNSNSSDTLASCLREAWKAIVIMDCFDMDADTKNTRYIPNRNTLKDLCDNLLLQAEQSHTCEALIMLSRISKRLLAGGAIVVAEETVDFLGLILSL